MTTLTEAEMRVVLRHPYALPLYVTPGIEAQVGRLMKAAARAAGNKPTPQPHVPKAFQITPFVASIYAALPGTVAQVAARTWADPLQTRTELGRMVKAGLVEPTKAVPRLIYVKAGPETITAGDTVDTAQ